MSRRSWLNTVAVILVVAGAVQAAGKAANATTPITGVDRSYMDLPSLPCKDFYAYANGAFEKVPIRPVRAYGVNQELDDRNFAILKESSKCGSGRRTQGSVVQRVGDFYASGMTRPRSTAKDAPAYAVVSAFRRSQVQGVVAVIAQCRPRSERRLPPRSGDRRQGHHGHDASFIQGGSGCRSETIIFREGKNAEDIRAAYVAHIARTLELLETQPGSQGGAASIMALKPSWRKRLARSWTCAILRRTTISSNGPR